MRIKQADELGKRVAELVRANRTKQAYDLLAPTLAQRTSFNLLDRLGVSIGTLPSPAANAFLKRIADGNAMGGYPIIGSALAQQLDRDLSGALARCRKFVIAGDIWYATDILGERVPGPALVNHFEQTLPLLTTWREDENRWVRRCIGVGVHVWAKRTRGAGEYVGRVSKLLDLLEPMFVEREMDAIKGVGWGLKTLGRYYPSVTTPWLERQVALHRDCYRALMLRKAVTYLSPKQRARVFKAVAQ